MPRAKSNARKTTIGIPADIDGWLEYAGRGVEGGMTGYLADLVRRDRDRFMAAPDDDGLAERYRAFLLATGRDAELAGLDDGCHAGRRQVEVWEVRTGDGGVGVSVAGGDVHMGYDAGDVERLVGAVLDGVPVGSENVIDAELAEAASPYLAGGDAYAERVAELAEALTL